MLDVLITEITKLLGRMAFEKSKNTVESRTAQLNHKIQTSPARLKRAIAAHRRLVLDWSNSLYLKGVDKSVNLSEAHVDLSITTYLRRSQYSSEDLEAPAQPTEHTIYDFDLSGHHILYGDIGSGKTTTLQGISRYLIKTSDTPVIVILLREIETDGSLFDYILRIFGVQFERDTSADSDKFKKFEFMTEDDYKLQIVCEVLSKIKATVILDGYDELPFQARSKVLREYERLIQSSISRSSVVVGYKMVPIAESEPPAERREPVIEDRIDYRFASILSSRPGELEARLADINELEIMPLNPAQQRQVARYYISIDRIDNFWKSVSSTTFSDMMEKPLLLVFICAVYESYRFVSEKPKIIYKLAIDLYIHQWDSDRGIHRHSKYASMTPQAKFEFLSAFAYYIIHFTNSPRPSFDTRLGQIIYKEIHDEFDLPIREALEVIKDMETTTGVIRRIGYDRYEFAHKSIQEYLAGDYLSRAGSLRNIDVEIENYPNELAVAIALSARPTLRIRQFFCEEIEMKKLSEDFYVPFLRRLIDEAPGFKRDVSMGGVVTRCLCNVRESVGAEILERLCSRENVKDSIKDYIADQTKARTEIVPGLGFDAIPGWIARIARGKKYGRVDLGE